jgi:putative flavoprotein involved in K+ transport
MTMCVHDVVVVGAGPAGLSVAYELARAGIQPVVLEKTAGIGDVWRHHYDGLRLNTGRRFSTLPGSPFPPEAGAWPSRDDFVRVLETFPARGGFAVKTGVDIESIEYDARGDHWTVTDTNGSLHLAHSVVVATGAARIPVIPQWRGMESFAGEILHSSHFRTATHYAGMHVLVVGAGNSSAEIASRLTAHASQVTLSVRTPPHVLPKSVWGVPLAGIGAATRRLPRPIVDGLLALLQRALVGDLAAYGLPRPRASVSEKFRHTHVTPTLYAGFASDICAGKIRVVGPIREIDGRDVHVWKTLDDARRPGGATVALAPNVIVAGTGFRTGITDLVKIPAITDQDDIPTVTGAHDSEHAPRLYFIGQSNPLSGQLREIGLEASAIARKVAGLRWHRRLPRKNLIPEESTSTASRGN